MPENDGSNKFLYWTPAIGGATYGGYRIAREVGSANPRSWFWNPSAPGRTVRDQVASNNMLRTAVPSTDYLSALDQVALEGSWKRLPTPWARSAIAEATRASLLQAARMPIFEIEQHTRNILAPRGYSNFFDVARQQVAQYGDPRTFMRTLERYLPMGGEDPFVGQALPGIFLGADNVTRLFEQAQQVGRAVTWSMPSGTAGRDWWTSKLGPKNRGILGGFLQNLGSDAVVTSIAHYTGDINMAYVGLQGIAGLEDLDELPTLRLPLHPTKYRKPQAEYVMNRIYTGLPSEGGKIVSWADYYIQQAKQTLVPELEEIGARGLDADDAARLVKQRINAFDTEMTRYMMWTPSIRHPGLDFINRINAQTIAAPELSESVVRNVRDKLPPDIDREMGILFKEQGLFPGMSGGQIMAGRMVGGADPRSMWAYGADFPFERRPLQFLREFAPTQGALTAMEANRPAFGLSRSTPFLATAARKELIQGGMAAPQLLVGYALKGGRAAQVLEETGLAAEELLTRQNVMSMFETERITQMKLGLHEPIGQGPGVDKWLKRAVLDDVNPLQLKPGQQIGYEMKTGKPLFAADVPGVRQELVGAQAVRISAGQEAAQVFVREIHTTDDYAKLFGQLKVTTRGRDAAYMSKVEKDLGLQMAKNLDAFTFSDELRKNRSFLKQQMASGLNMLAQQRINTLDELSDAIAAARKAGAPYQHLDTRFDRLLAATSADAITEMKQFAGLGAEAIETMLPDELSILRKGKEWGLDIRLIGGAMEDAADILPAGILEQARAFAGQKGLVHPSGMVVGTAVSHVGAYRHTMGGGILEGGIRGSMEPRGILSLLQHKWNVGDQNVAHMLAAENLRLMTDYSQDIDEVLKVSRSLLGEEIKGLEKVTAWAGEGQVRQLPMRKAGYILDLGTSIPEFGGASSVYVPGEEAMRRFAQFRSETGDILRTDLAQKYQNLMRAATRVRNVGNQNVALTALGTAATELNQAIMQEAGASMYGRGGGSRVYGALRGKRLGSQFLAVSSIDEVMSTVSEGVIELSDRAANEMFSELQQAANTAADRDFIRAQRKAFLGGETIAGQVARHPFIGPYSIQPTLIRRAPGASSAAEYFVRAPASVEETVGVVGEARKTLGNYIKSNISPMVGLAGDYDDDRLIVGLIGDEKTARATEELLHGGQYMREYRKFATEAGVLKALAKNQLGTAAAPQLSDIDKLILGSTKLRVGQAETAGISLALSEAKLAMSYYRPEQASKFNLIAEMMEQQIISGKKMTEVGKQNIANTVASAIQQIGSPHESAVELQKLVDETTKMFGPELQAGIQLESAQLGQWTMQTDPKQLWQEAQAAIQQGREKGGIITRYRQMARGNIHIAELTVSEVINQIEGARAGKLDSLSMLAASGPATTPRGKMGHAVGGAIRGLNEGMKRMGAAAKTGLRPALVGLAGTAAAVMLLGAPKPQPLDTPPPAARGDRRRIGDTDLALSRATLQGITPNERDLRPESMPVPDSVTGTPTSPGMMTPSTYMTNSAPLGHRVVARATADTFVPDNANLAQALRPVLGNASMRINFRDNRSKLTSQAIADMLEEA